MRMMRLIGATAVASALVAVCGAAQAHPTFTGSSVTATLYKPEILPGDILGGPTTATVGSGVEFPAGSIHGNTTFSIDLTSDEILYTPLTNVTYSNGPFNGF